MITHNNTTMPAFKGYITYNDGKTNILAAEDTTYEQDRDILNSIKTRLEKGLVYTEKDSNGYNLMFGDLKVMVSPDRVDFVKGDSLYMMGAISPDDLKKNNKVQKKFISNMITFISELASKQNVAVKPLVKKPPETIFPDINAAFNNVMTAIKSAIYEIKS